MLTAFRKADISGSSAAFASMPATLQCTASATQAQPVGCCHSGAEQCFDTPSALLPDCTDQLLALVKSDMGGKSQQEAVSPLKERTRK